MKKFLILSSLFLLLIPLGVQAVQSFLTFYVNVMDYGTVLMLQNQSNVLTLYEIPSSFSSIPSFQGVQTTGKALEAVENVTLKSGEVALVHEYGVSGFSTQNFLYQQVNVPGIVTHSNFTTSDYSSSTLSVTPNPGYQLQFTPWFGIQNQPVDTVESTAWKVLPYWENSELVINSTGASIDGQYIAWGYSPISNVINVTVHVIPSPSINGGGINLFSPNIGDQTSEGNTGFYALLVTFYGGHIFYHSPTSGFTQIYSSLPQPNPNYPFTMSVIFTENSAGNVTVSTLYINSTAYTVNVNTPYPWSQIGYVGIRANYQHVFYVSYFGVSPAPYDGVEQFMNDVESTSWKVLPYWQNGKLVVNSTGAGAGQYIAWKYSPISNIINATIYVTSYPSGIQNSPGIVVYSSNIGDQTSDNDVSNFQGLLVTFNGNIFYHSTTSGYTLLKSSAFPTPSTSYPFTFSVILTENSTGYVTVSTVYINSAAYTVNVSTPFPWSQIGYAGIRGDAGNLFYVSYFGVSPFQYGIAKYTINSISLPSMPDTSSATVLISQLSNGSYAILGMYNGTWHELNLPFTNPSGKFTITFNPMGPVNITLKSSNVLSYGALFSPGNGVLLEAQNAIPPSNPTTFAPLAYVGTNGEVGGGVDPVSPQFTPATLNSINYLSLIHI